MNHYPASVPGRVVKWLENWLTTQKISDPIRVEPLAGDGSTRNFFRVSWPGKTCILLSDPEWIFSKDYASHQAHLAKCKIPVPQFFSVDAGVGALVMEDMGDELLQFQIQKAPASRMQWLGEAVKLLARLHGTSFPVPRELPVSERRFDEAKYFQELSYTQEHLAEKFLGEAPLAETEKRALAAFCRRIEGIGPTVFSHRDYHTRNLLLRQDRLFLIDFQDARLGPPHYDLASILFDAYVPVSDAERQGLTGTYKTELSQFPNLYEKISWDRLEEEMGWVAFQRVVKAAGSFASFFTRNGKTTHLPYLVPALESALSLRKRYPEIQKVVGESIPLEKWLSEIRAKKIGV